MLCCMLTVEKISRSNDDSTVTSVSNLIRSVSKPWFFLGDASVSKHRTWQLLRNLLNFLSQPLRIISCHYGKSHVFLTSFAFFRIKKPISYMLLVECCRPDVSNFFSFLGYGLKIDSTTWIWFFYPFLFIISCTCRSTLTYIH